MLTQLVPLILFGIATGFSPGPNNIMTSYTAFNFGVKKAIPTMSGVIIGWTLLIILLQLGSASVFQRYEFIQTTIKILGSNKYKKVSRSKVKKQNKFFFFYYVE